MSVPSDVNNEIYDGKLIIKIVEARDLRKLNNAVPAMKPFCVISFEKQEIKTRPAEDLINPVWNEEYTFDVTNPNSEIVIYIGEFGITPAAMEDEFMSMIKLKVSGLIDQKVHDTWMKLLPVKLKEKVYGDLRVMLQYITNKGRISPDDFENLTLLGKGNYGKVILVKKKDTGRVYAMKILRKEVIVPDEVEHTKAERYVLGSINHLFIVSLKYSFQTQGKLYLIQDFINGGDLFFHLKKDISFNEERAKFYTAELVLALNFLHIKHDIVYRDLKPENVLLDYKGHVCLVDFGLCKKGISSDTSTTFCGTAEYLAPEVLMAQVSKEGYGKEVDWWNLGILLYEMLTGLTPFYSDNVQKMYKNILFAPLVFPAHVSENAKSLLTGLLTRDPKKRLGAGKEDADPIKAHSFFANINWNNLDKKQIKPPFTPNTNGPMDTSNFDPQFTVERPVDSLVDTTKITASMQDLFQDFSFINESLLYSSDGSLNGDTLRNRSASSPYNNSNLGS